MTSMKCAIAAVLACAALPILVHASDWPQWRGPNRDNKVAGFTAPASWPKELTQKWKVTVGLGEAAPTARYKESVSSVETFLGKVDPRALSFKDVEGSMEFLQTLSRRDMSAKCALNLALLWTCSNAEKSASATPSSAGSLFRAAENR